MKTEAISPAYVAGFLDGEGYLTILRRNQSIGYTSHGLHIGFTNRNLAVLQAIKSRYGGVIFAKKRYSQKHSTAFELRINNKDCVKRLLEEVLPYLIVKNKQAELGLAFLKLGKIKMVMIKTRGKSWPLFKGNPEDVALRDELKQNLELLNMRGPECLQ